MNEFRAKGVVSKYPARLPFSVHKIFICIPDRCIVKFVCFCWKMFRTTNSIFETVISKAPLVSLCSQHTQRLILYVLACLSLYGIDTVSVLVDEGLFGNFG